MHRLQVRLSRLKMKIFSIIPALLICVWLKPVLVQFVCYNVTDPEAKNIIVIYHSKDGLKLFDHEGSLSDCSESESVELNTCRVCERWDQVFASCHLSDPSADLDFEASGKGIPLQKTLCDADTTLAKTTPSTAPPLQLTTPSTTLQPDAPPPPGLSEGAIAGICVGVGVLVVLGYVAYIQRENIRTWWRRRYDPVPPAANGHAPTGHAPTDHAPNGHAPTDHAPNGHAPTDHVPNGHAPTGHALTSV